MQLRELAQLIALTVVVIGFLMSALVIYVAVTP